MKDLHILKGLMVGLKTAVIEIAQLIVKVVYYIIRNIDNGVAYVFMKLPRLARVGIVYTMIALSIVGIFSIVPNKNVDTKVIQTNVSNIVEKVETTEQVEETETTEQVEVAIVETTSTCKINNADACYIYDNALVYGFTHEQALILVAMSRAETSWTSDLYVNGYNFAGIKHNGKFARYDTKEEGLKNFFDNMKRYFDNGKDTIEKIGASWCPPSDPNDTKGLNKNWVRNVTSIYNQYSALYE